MEGSKHSLFHCSKHFRMCQQTNNAVLIFWQGTQYTYLLMYIHSRLLYNRCSAYTRRRLTQKTLRLKAKNRASTPAARRSGTPYWGSIYIHICAPHQQRHNKFRFLQQLHALQGREECSCIGQNSAGLWWWRPHGICKEFGATDDEHNVLHIGLVG